MTQEGRKSKNGGLLSPQHRPTAREAPRGPANQPRMKVLWGEVIEAGTGVTRSRPLNVYAHGARFNDYIAVAGAAPG